MTEDIKVTLARETAQGLSEYVRSLNRAMTAENLYLNLALIEAQSIHERSAILIDQLKRAGAKDHTKPRQGIARVDQVERFRDHHS